MFSIFYIWNCRILKDTANSRSNVFSTAVLIFLYAIVAFIQMVRASKTLHTGMLANVLRSPMMFFDTTPSGRIVNRFSRDVETLDNTLPQQLRSWMNTFFGALSTLVIISYSTPIFMAVILPLGVFYYLVQVSISC